MITFKTKYFNTKNIGKPKIKNDRYFIIATMISHKNNDLKITQERNYNNFKNFILFFFVGTQQNTTNLCIVS